MQLESTIAVLQNSVSKLTSENEALKRRIETEAKENVDAKINLENELNLLQQYSRRQCLRVDGVKVSDDIETSEDVVKIVHDFMKDVGIKRSDMVIDRVHRIGLSYMNEDNEKVGSIIVNFTNFRVRILFYDKRKNLDRQIKVRIDLTKRNYDLLKKTRDLIKARVNPKYMKNIFAFADINCCIKIVDDSSKEKAFINSIEDADLFLSQS